MKLFSGLKLYPNGFLGAPIEFAKVEVDDSIKLDLIGGSSKRFMLGSENDSITPNKEIEELYERILQKEDILRDSMAFRERVFLAALRAFGTEDFTTWFELQKSNPYFGSMQNRFVEETIGFIYGKDRMYHPAVYMDSMLINAVNAFSVGVNAKTYLYSNTNQRVMVKDIIQKWVSRTNGMSDMIISLRILFGQ